MHAWQVVAAANIIGAGNGLEVGRELELLTIRGAEAEAEQAVRLSAAAPAHSGMVALGSTAIMQVLTCCILLCLSMRVIAGTCGCLELGYDMPSRYLASAGIPVSCYQYVVVFGG